MEESKTQLQAFFELYGASFRNAKKIRAFYGDCAMAAEPASVGCLKGRDEVTQALETVSAYQVKTGLKSMVPAAVDEWSVDALHRWAKVKWKAMFERTGDRTIMFDVSYLVRMETERPRILLYISHQDEEQMRKALGVD